MYLHRFVYICMLYKQQQEDNNIDKLIRRVRIIKDGKLIFKEDVEHEANNLETFQKIYSILAGYLEPESEEDFAINVECDDGDLMYIYAKHRTKKQKKQKK